MLFELRWVGSQIVSCTFTVMYDFVEMNEIPMNLDWGGCGKKLWFI